MKSGEKQIVPLIENNMKEGTNLGALNCGLTKRNRSGVRGVYWDSAQQKWNANMTFKKKRYHLGFYEKIEDAAKARAEAEEKYFNPILMKYDRKPAE
jgi:hypothetical protein